MSGTTQKGVAARTMVPREEKQAKNTERFLPVALTRLQWSYVAAMCLIAATLVLPLITLGRYMLGVDYYQHFPLLLLGAAALGFTRVRQNPIAWIGTFSIRVLAFSILCTLLTAAVFVIPSRWLGTFAMLAWLIAMVNFIGGRRLALLLFGPFLLLVAAVPLPVHFDNWFVVALQNLATRLASIWLDFAGVLHFTTGVSIQTADHNYYVKDACSGIHSVFAAFAVGMGYAVLRRYRILRIVFFLFQLLFWVVIANGLRVFLTIYLQRQYRWNLIDGAYHEILGMVTFICGVLLAVSGDRFLDYLVPPEKLRAADEWRIRLAKVRQNPWLDMYVTPQIAVSIMGVLFVCGAGAAFAFYRYQTPRATVMTREELTSTACLDVFGVNREFVSSSVEDTWSLSNYYREDRDENSLFGGLISHVWQFTHISGRRVLISLDGAYDNWHDLSVCYSGAGWHVDHMQTIETNRDGEPFYACELALARDPIDHAQVLYVCVDPAGEDVKPPAYFGNAFMSLAKRFGIGTQDRQAFDGGVIQLQLLDERPGVISEVQKQENRDLFWTLVGQVFSSHSK